MTRVAYFRFKDTKEIVAVLNTGPSWDGFLDSYMFVGQHGPISKETLVNDCDLVLGVPEDEHGNLEEHLQKVAGYEDLYRDNLWIMKELRKIDFAPLNAIFEHNKVWAIEEDIENSKLNIEYEIWTSDCSDPELRIDLGDLDEEEYKFVEEELVGKKIPYGTTYVIFY